MKRTQKANQVLPARHDVHSASTRPSTRQTTTKTRTRAASTSLKPSTGGRDVKHTSLRLPHGTTTKEVSKSASFSHMNSTKSRVAEVKWNKNLPTEQEAFYLNLLLLGFSAEDVSARHRGASIPFDKDMFSVPNMLAFQVVMHFLFNKLDSVKFNEDFRDCWPICDRKQEQMFRKACISWLTEISEKNSDAHLPRLVPSLLLSPGGSRLYQLLLAISRFIITKLIKDENGRRITLKVQHPILTPKTIHLSDLWARTMQELVARRRANIFSSIQQSIIVHNEWKQFADDLVKDNRYLSKELREKQRLLEELDHAPSVGGHQNQSPGRLLLSPRGLDQVTADRRQHIRKVRDDWCRLTSYCKNTSKERDVVSSIVKGSIDKYHIRASDFSLQVPDVLLRTCSEEIQSKSIGNTYEGGKLDLISVLKLWNLSLGICRDHAAVEPTPKLEEFSSNLIGHVHDVTAYLANLRALRNKLQNVDAPDLRDSIAGMRAEITRTISTKTPQKIWSDTKDNLGFLPPTPPVSFEPDVDLDSSLIPHMLGKTPPTVGGTPEAASRIVNAAKKRAQRRQQGSGSDNSRLPKRLITEDASPSLDTDENEPPVSAIVAPPLERLSRGFNMGAVNAAGRVLTPIRPRVVNHLTSSGAKKDDRPPAHKSSFISAFPQKPSFKPSLNPRPIKNERKLSCKKAEPMKAIPLVTISQFQDEAESRDEDSAPVFRGCLVSKELFIVRQTPNKQVGQQTPVKVSTAEDHLIDRMVDAIVGTTPRQGGSISAMCTPRQDGAVSAESTPGYDTDDVNLADPLLALDVSAAFGKRDRIANSPLSGSTVAPDSDHVRFKDLDPLADSPPFTPRFSKPTHRSPLIEIEAPSPVSRLSFSTNNNSVTPSTATSLCLKLDEPNSVSPLKTQFLDMLTVETSTSPSVTSNTITSFANSSQSVKSTINMYEVPVLDLRAISPVDDVLETSLELVPLDESSDSEISELTERDDDDDDVNPCGNLLGFVPREPTPSCITPYKGMESTSVGDLSSENPTQLALEGGVEEYVNDFISEQSDANVLNSDERIEQLYEFEKSFEEGMLNLSLRVTGTPDYATGPGSGCRDVRRSCDGSLIGETVNSSLVEGLTDEDDTRGLPRTPLDFSQNMSTEGVAEDIKSRSRSPYMSPRLRTPRRHIKLEISPQLENISPAIVQGSSMCVLDFSKIVNHGEDIDIRSPILLRQESDAFESANKSPRSESGSNKDNCDLMSRFRSLKMRAKVPANKTITRVLTPVEDEQGLDEVYLQQSPRYHQVEDEDNDDVIRAASGKFALDLVQFDEFLDSDTESIPGKKREDKSPAGAVADHSEVVFRSPDKLIQKNKSFTPTNAMNLSGQGLDFLDIDADDILIPDSPVGGASSRTQDLINW